LVAWRLVEPRVARVAVLLVIAVQAVVVAVLLRLGRHRPMIIPFVAHGTPVVANGVLYITGQNKLYAIAGDKR
jgi:hypothetical protein